jgi:hypothetical protein
MKNEYALKVYLLPQLLLQSQWDSLLGDKYAHALPFRWEFTDDPALAHVIAWDGFYSPKARTYYEEVIALIKSGNKVLLLQREAFTLFNSSPFLESINVEQFPIVELSVGNALPEDLLAALEACRKKVNNV